MVYLGKELNEFKQEVKKEFKQLHDKVDKLENKVDKLENKVDKLENKVDKGFKELDARLTRVEVISINNQKSLEDLQNTVNKTAETIDKLYNKIDNFLVIARKTEEEVTILAHRQINHEDRITALEEKAS